MKKLFYYLGPLVLAIVAAFLVNAAFQDFDNPGYALLGIGHWSMETSLVVFAIGQVIVFYVLYVFFRLLGYLIRLPAKLKARGRNVKFNRSQEALIAGLVDSAEGNWERAESVLIKHVSHSGAPLLHYLTAARAAQSRGAFDKRDEYLKKATDHSPDSSVLIGLTHAELSLSGNQFEQALETLTRLHSIDPTHATVLKLMHQTYQSLGDWQGLRALLPSLHTNQVLMENEVKELEIEAFTKLLQEIVKTGTILEVQQLWQEIPVYIRNIGMLAATYFACMINAGLGTQIEEELANTVTESWDDALVVLYGSIDSRNIANQLETAEKWAYMHPDNAILLALIGKLAIKTGDTFKAESFLAKSIAAEPTVQAYQLLGDLLFAQDDKDNAIACYKNGIELVSNELVNQFNS
ncbi:MAG: heme biosynthesis protein HemY [Methylococcales bacterium]|nr:heme biosynthesis protein HemY [Methylococcales bacterium]